MKKLSFLAVTTAAAIAGSSVLPAQAANTEAIDRQMPVTSQRVTVIQGSSLEELKNQLDEKLNGLEGSLGDIYWQVCPPDITLPDGSTPNQPDGSTPDTDQPGTDAPEDNQPDTEQPGGDMEAPDGGNGQPDDMEKPGGDTDKPDGDSSNPGGSTHDRTFVQQVVDLVNAERVKAGLTTLAVDEKIEAAALVRAKETEISFSHTRPNGTSFSTALTEQGVSYSGSGENIAWGQRTPQEVMTGWMNSDGHRANILNPRFTKIGVGYYQNEAGRNYWTQLFTY